MPLGKIAKTFEVKPDHAVDLDKRPTLVDPVYTSKADYRSILEAHVGRLSALQDLLYATHRHALLVIFQAMDTGGKDGCIKHVMSGVNPQGCNVYSYSHPTRTELRHDFLWRTTRDLPERGMMTLFNRSYYEEVLIVRVHPEILEAEGYDGHGDDKGVWKERYRAINALERHLCESRTRVVKIFLHISKEEQRKRLLVRLDEPQKHWKISPDDIVERGFWDRYQKAYERCFEATSTKHAPWHIVAADDKLNARLFVSQIILDALERLDMSYPRETPERRKELEAMRKGLASE